MFESGTGAKVVVAIPQKVSLPRRFGWLSLCYLPRFCVAGTEAHYWEAYAILSGLSDPSPLLRPRRADVALVFLPGGD